ncbi:MAG: hypothetical protein ACOX1P_27965 [Thermoguttaceae bacterium]|jgi:Tol biopolymer transport system component
MPRSVVFIALSVIGVVICPAAPSGEPERDPRARQLAEQVRAKGWIAYSARSDNGTWDVFLSRPDGSQRRNITNTPNYEEAAPMFRGDGKKLLYRQIARGSTVSHDRWGFQGRLVIADPGGANAAVVGQDGQWPWASWSPDGKQIACLVPQGIQIVDLASKKVVRSMPREGIYQQLFWSPDGEWFCGTGNHLGVMWTVVRLHLATGKLNAVHKFQSCTPAWFPDSKHIIFSSRPAGQTAGGGYGWTQLWMAVGDGSSEQLVYGEDGCHVYGGALSPDGQYVLFTKSLKDGGGSEDSGGAICLMRFSDAPTIGGASEELRAKHAGTKDGPVVELGQGWEPCWTYEEIGTAQ